MEETHSVEGGSPAKQTYSEVREHTDGEWWVAAPVESCSAALSSRTPRQSSLTIRVDVVILSAAVGETSAQLLSGSCREGGVWSIMLLLQNFLPDTASSSPCV